LSDRPRKLPIYSFSSVLRGLFFAGLVLSVALARRVSLSLPLVEPREVT